MRISAKTRLIVIGHSDNTPGMHARMIFPALILLCVCGCITPGGQERLQSEARHNAMIQNLQADVEKLRNQVETLTEGRNEIYQLVGDVQHGSNSSRNNIGTRLDAIEKALDDLEAARIRDREVLLNDLSQKISQILKTQQRPKFSETGREHEVEAGQTLSDIALAYEVTVNSIVQANNLPNANDIRVGQKLFIPE